MATDGVNKLISNGSRVIVGRFVSVKVGKGVFETFGVPVGGVVVGRSVLITKKSGVKVAGRLNGVAVAFGGLVGIDVPRNGIETGNAVHPASTDMIMTMNTSFFMKHLWLSEA